MTSTAYVLTVINIQAGIIAMEASRSKRMNPPTIVSLTETDIPECPWANPMVDQIKGDVVSHAVYPNTFPLNPSTPAKKNAPKMIVTRDTRNCID